MSTVPQPKLFADLPDHASEHDTRQLAIDKVGIKDLSYPIQVLDRNNQVQHTVAMVNLYVGLPHHFKGTHMSRFIEILNARRGEMTIRNMPQVLTEIQQRLEADDAFIEVHFPYFISKKAPISGVESLMEYKCAFHAAKRGPNLDFMLKVQVPVKSLCPCSKSISKYGAHNQRSLVDVSIRARDFVWIEDVVDVVEKCASAPLFALLKREDEKYITELAYENPKFVEDLVRDAVLGLKELPGVKWLSVSAENQESIHNHSAYGEIEWSSEEDALKLQEALPFAPTTNEETEIVPFGSWLRQQRQSRSYSQQEFADHLGISAAHLSRVESGEKRLSEAGLARIAELLSFEESLVMLRAGMVPESLMNAILRNPEAFQNWARSTS